MTDQQATKLGAEATRTLRALERDRHRYATDAYREWNRGRMSRMRENPEYQAYEQAYERSPHRRAAKALYGMLRDRGLR